MSFLNETGLTHLWGKITTELNNKLNTKVDKVTGKGLSTNDYTKAEKDKLTNIATGATRVLVDSSLSTSSTNAIQNAPVATAINNCLPKSQFYEAYLGYGGKDIAGGVSPIDCAMSSLHNANRAELCNPDGITIEYSTDGLNSWTDYNADSSSKIRLLSTIGNPFYLGKSTGKNTNTKIGLRVTLDATKMGLYTALTKILINYSTNGASGTKVKFEYSNKGSEDTWKNYKTSEISGWSGWNSYCFGCSFGGSPNQTFNWARIRMTFSMSGVNSNYDSNPIITNIILLGTTYWGYPSNLAKNGHLYLYDADGNATFPAGLTAKTLNGHTIHTDVPAGAKFTDTTYNEATKSVAGLMSAKDKVKITDIASGATRNIASTTVPKANGTASAGSEADFARGDHVHPLQTSVSGNAGTATKLAAARTINFAGGHQGYGSFDGSKNLTINLWGKNVSANNANTNNYPYHRFAKIDTLASTYTDKSAAYIVSGDYVGGGWGIFRLILRTNNTGNVSLANVEWIVREGLDADFIQVGLYNVFGSTYADAYLKTPIGYGCYIIHLLESGKRGGVEDTWQLISSEEVSNTTTSNKGDSQEVYASIESAATILHGKAYSIIIKGIDKGTVSYANSAGLAANATKATQDASGNTITSTYATKIELNGKANSSHTHNYAGSSSAGGAATSANKLNTNAGSAIQPVFFSNGVPVVTTYTLEKSVPANAVFTDTTYNDVTTSTHGLMTAADKTKLNGIAQGATRNIVRKFGITLSADRWSEGAPYYQNIFYQGISEEDTPFIMPKLDSNTDLAMVQLDGWSCISQATARANIIQFKCFEKKPEIDIPLIVQVIS